MAVIGVQSPTDDIVHGPEYQELIEFMENAPGDSKPRYWEAAAVVDHRGHLNEVVIPYWPQKADYDRWRRESGFDSWWASRRPGAAHGWFLEVFLPTLDRFETVFSDPRVPEGAAHMRESVSAEIEQHVYWGSMRDRLAAAQTDPLAGDRVVPEPSTGRASEGQPDTRGRRVRVRARRNLAVIRSGQDWSDTTPDERKLYLDTMHPVLVRGMDFLRDRGAEVGCISNRFMKCTDKTAGGGDPERTFGLAYFDDLQSLEGWSREHQTHLDIFGRFLGYAKELGNNVSLRLFHEVMVLSPDQQLFEYVGCHDTTGMLASM
jgi:hypothetical protein